jgi:hypothetical protein
VADDLAHGATLLSGDGVVELQVAGLGPSPLTVTAAISPGTTTRNGMNSLGKAAIRIGQLLRGFPSERCGERLLCSAGEVVKPGGG